MPQSMRLSKGLCSEAGDIAHSDGLLTSYLVDAVQGTNLESTDADFDEVDDYLRAPHKHLILQCKSTREKSDKGPDGN